ncbi:MAG: glycosyltransferase family 2 protein [Sphingomonadales bacterium]
MVETVSCILPVYNGADYLEEAVASVEAQSWGPVEILVVDDGSTDGTPDLIARLGTRVRAFRQENAGAAAARNLGLAHASGSFIGFHDADDLWLPQKIAVQMARFEARAELDLCICRAENWWIAELSHEAEAAGLALTEGRTGAFPTVLARRSLFERTGPLDNRLRHLDMTEWLLRVADVGAVSEMIDEPLVRRRIHFSNTSRHRGDSEARERMIIAQNRISRRKLS